MVESGERTALPLAQAAEHLGISPNALRMRVARGRAEGMRREGRLYVYVDAPIETPRLPAPSPPESTVHDTLLELQRTELSRLLAENRRLNDRLQQLFDLLRTDQSQRQSLQDIILELARDRSLPALDQIYSRLDRLEGSAHALRHSTRQLTDAARRGERQIRRLDAIQIRRLDAMETDTQNMRRSLALIANLLARRRRGHR